MPKSFIKVQTWGTTGRKGNGIMRFLSSRSNEENPGHASIEMQLPVNETNDALIKQYCSKKPIIPHTLKRIVNEDGTSELVHVVRFSFIPNSSMNLPFYLNQTYKDDTVYERPGQNTSERHYLEIAELVERKGAKRSVYLYPAASLTEKGRAIDFTSAKGKYLLNLKELAQYKDLTDTISVLSAKKNELKQRKKAVELKKAENKTFILAAKRLGIELPQNTKINIEELDEIIDITKLQEEVSAKIKELTNKNNELVSEITQTPLRNQYKKKQKEIALFSEFLKKFLASENLAEEKLLQDFEQYCSSNSAISAEFIEIIKQRINRLVEIQPEGMFGEKVQEWLKELKIEHLEYSNKLKLLKIEEDQFFSNLGDYICYGRPADGEVQLPVGEGKFELDSESMLAQMRMIIDSNFEYNLYTHHCSSTTLSILEAGKKRVVSEVNPAKVVNLTTPQTVFNEAMALRERVCKISAKNALADLDTFYSTMKQNSEIRVVPQKCNDLHEAVLSFAVDNIFPEKDDVMTKTFYVFTEKDKQNLIKLKNEPIPTELLRDLWGIIPYRTLPLSADGANNVVIDQNMSIGELVQGLTILAQNNAKNRLNIQQELSHSIQDPYQVLRNKIESEIERLGKREDKNSIVKATSLMNAYINIVQELRDEIPQKTSKEKSEILYKELIPLLKVNTGLNIREATALRAVKKVATELGITGNTESVTKYKAIIKNMSDETTLKDSIDAESKSASIKNS